MTKRLIVWLFPVYIVLMGAGSWLVMEIADARTSTVVVTEERGQWV